MATRVIHDRLVEGVAKLIQDLALAGVAGTIADINSNVYQQILPEMLNVRLPCILVTCDGEADEEGDSDFEDDVVIHPVQVLIIDAMAPNRDARRSTYQRWKHDIAARLRGLVEYPLLPEVSELYDVRLKNLADSTGRGRSPLFQAGLVVMCHTNEPRDRGQG